MLSYRVTLDVPLPPVLFVSRLLADHRPELGTPGRDACPDLLEAAVFILAWFRDRPDIRRLRRSSRQSGEMPNLSRDTYSPATGR